MNKRTLTYQGKRLTPRTAVRSFCRWCNGGSAATCVSPTCDLYTYRNAQAVPEGLGSPLRAIRARCLECAGSVEAVRTCAAHKSFSETQPECPLWPHREGKRNVSAEYRAQRREQAMIQFRKTGPEATFTRKKATNELGLGEGRPGLSSKAVQLNLFHMPGGDV